MKASFQNLSSFYSRKPETAISIIITLATGIWLILARFMISPNTMDYDPQVNSIVFGRAFYNEEGEFLGSYPPVWPLLLSAITWMSHQLHINRLFLAIPFMTGCYMIGGILIYRICRMLRLTSVVPIILIIGVINPLMLSLVTRPLSEPVYFLWLMLSFHAFVQFLVRDKKEAYKHLFWCGLWLGLGWITRPISILIPFCLAFIVWLSMIKQAKWTSFLYPALLLCISLLVIVPWQWYSYKQSGEFHFLSSRGTNGLRDGLSYTYKGWREPFHFPPDVEGVLNRFAADYESYQETSSIITFLKREIGSDPVAVIKLYLIKAGRSWYGSDTHTASTELVAMIIMIPVGLLFLVAGFRVWKQRQTEPLFSAFSLAVVLVVGSVWAINTMASSLVRYMVPYMGIMGIVIAWMLMPVFRFGKKDDSMR